MAAERELLVSVQCRVNKHAFQKQKFLSEEYQNISIFNAGATPVTEQAAYARTDAGILWTTLRRLHSPKLILMTSLRTASSACILDTPCCFITSV